MEGPLQCKYLLWLHVFLFIFIFFISPLKIKLQCGKRKQIMTSIRDYTLKVITCTFTKTTNTFTFCLKNEDIFSFKTIIHSNLPQAANLKCEASTVLYGRWPLIRVSNYNDLSCKQTLQEVVGHLGKIDCLTLFSHEIINEWHKQQWKL